MRAQRKSELVKHGEGDPHTKARERLAKILVDNGWLISENSSFHIGGSMLSIYGSTIKRWDYYHEYDIFAWKENSNGLTSELMIEIDGSAHNSKVQKGKDKTAEEYARFFLPDAKFRRIRIGEVIGKYQYEDQEMIEVYKLT